MFLENIEPMARMLESAEDITAAESEARPNGNIIVLVKN